MDFASSRVQLRWIALGYALVSLFTAVLLYGRHLQELQNPADAAGGMWAAGDSTLYFFIAGLFMIPTAFLIWVIARFEALGKVYSQVLLGLRLSAPVCPGVFTLGESTLGQGIGGYCLLRLLCSAFFLFGIGVSRLTARFDRAKKLTSHALLIEGLTLAAAVALLTHHWGAPANR